MFSDLLFVLPVFGLVLAGWILRRSGAIGPGVARILTRLVVWLALPALLFQLVAKSDPAGIWQPGFIAAFSLGCAAVFAVTLAVRRRQGRSLADAAHDSLGASYANTGFLGLPLMMMAFGEAAMQPALIATIITVCILYVFAHALIETCPGGGRGFPLKVAALSLLGNPVLIAPALGGLVMMTGFVLPGPADRMLTLLADAAGPCALLALGLFLAGSCGPSPARPEAGVMVFLVTMKLLIHPGLTWLIAGPVLHLTEASLQSAVLLAAMPTGTGALLLAVCSGCDVSRTSRLILATTALSPVTLAFFLALLA